MSLIRREWCGMSYDGDVHANCPHCMAPRTECEPTHVERSAEENVFYADDMPYWPTHAERRTEESVFYADNVRYWTSGVVDAEVRKLRDEIDELDGRADELLRHEPSPEDELDELREHSRGLMRWTSLMLVVGVVMCVVGFFGAMMHAVGIW